MGNRSKRNLGKYDAPLVIQYRKGMDDFQKGRLSNPFHKDTMQYREWNRGFNKAYFDRLRKVKKYESKGSKNIGEGSKRMDTEKAQFHAT
ncbi:MAG: hypothetical protein CBD97_00270 [Pelagibacteraceae bacterium TMED237]|nr:MAG: hypothetical protein CBD97_00270 [Pelagibacteraceae bacterium TMED237]|tara:strand:+ start:2480 stop:2749 length:270 start_codon:yes stop_codon:yes gene_type:complete